MSSGSSFCLHRGEIGDVARDGLGAAAGRFDFVDDAVRAFGRKIVDVDDAGIVRREMQRDLPADALPGAGDQRVFAFQIQNVHRFDLSAFEASYKLGCTIESMVAMTRSLA